MTHSKWDRRIERAGELAVTHPYASEVLHFYKQVAALQKVIYLYFEDICNKTPPNTLPGSLMVDANLDLLQTRFRYFLSALETVAARPIAKSACELNSRDAEQHRNLFVTYWEASSDFQTAPGNIELLITGLFLQPYAESLADHADRTLVHSTAPTCPFCSGKPLVGVLRQEGDGAKRFLTCSMCSTEWAFGRILCPACGEDSVDKLAVYTADQINHVRVEACDTCSYYIKTVDLTKNGLAVPAVDELATIPLNFWAHEHGYVKVWPNLLGI